jgi:alpha-1,3-mannosyltransferase
MLGLHITLLLLFLTTRWKAPSRRSLTDFIRMAFDSPSEADQRVTSRLVDPQFILTTVLTANAIGMLCARSLHYQFYAWHAWGTPFLLWRTGFHPVVQGGLWALQEWAWNVYPSTFEVIDARSCDFAETDIEILQVLT